jgi:hypothetical protein
VAGATVPASREMDVAFNPYAAGLRGPGSSKRAWDVRYIERFQQTKDGDPVRIELTDGVIAEGIVKIVQFNGALVSYVSGELTAPEKGKFFFLTPPEGGKAGNGAHPSELNDGIHGKSFAAVGNTVDGAWTTVGATATYQLGAGPNGTGFDLFSIQSIAAWVDVAFGNQAWTVDAHG